MKQIAIIIALLAAPFSAVTQAADWSVAASGIPAASSVAAPPTFGK